MTPEAVFRWFEGRSTIWNGMNTSSPVRQSPPERLVGADRVPAILAERARHPEGVGLEAHVALKVPPELVLLRLMGMRSVLRYAHLQ
jgi:hypothetical protein